MRHEGPVRTVDDLELRTLTWVHWFNQTRLHSALGQVPPVDYEQVRTCQFPPRSHRCRGKSPPLNPCSALVGVLGGYFRRFLAPAWGAQWRRGTYRWPRTAAELGKLSGVRPIYVDSPPRSAAHGGVPGAAVVRRPGVAGWAQAPKNPPTNSH